MVDDLSVCGLFGKLDRTTLRKQNKLNLVHWNDLSSKHALIELQIVSGSTKTED